MRRLIYSANNYPGFTKGSYATNFGNFIESYWDISKLKAIEYFHEVWRTNETCKKQRSFIMVSTLNNGFVRDIQRFTETPTLADIKHDMRDMYPSDAIGDRDAIILGRKYKIVRDTCAHSIPIGTIITITEPCGDFGYHQDYNDCYITREDIQRW